MSPRGGGPAAHILSRPGVLRHTSTPGHSAPVPRKYLYNFICWAKKLENLMQGNLMQI